MLRAGLGAPRDTAQAYSFFRQGADIGHLPSVYHAGVHDAGGEGTPRDCPLAVRRFRSVAAVGSWAEPLQWALKKHLAGDAASALREYDQMAELGYTAAAYNAAWLRDQSRLRALSPGLTPAQAARARQGAERRFSRLLELGAYDGKDLVVGWAHLRLGDCRYYGTLHGCAEVNRSEALKHYRSAGDLGSTQGILSLGHMHLAGEAGEAGGRPGK
mmetsp:Transcript_36980/g.116329  ORF Transcript_36980/g.116329 Transcript_36980/m.116329 type:complete len:215 (+) Transcript_36980:91-735(+)